MAQDPKVLEAKFKQAFSDETFAKKIMTLETPKEVQVMLRTKDIDLSVEEISQVKDFIVERLAGGDELSDAQLENVSGGSLTFLLGAAVVLAITTGALGAGIVVGGGWATDRLTKGAW